MLTFYYILDAAFVGIALLGAVCSFRSENHHLEFRPFRAGMAWLSMTALATSLCLLSDAPLSPWTNHRAAFSQALLQGLNPYLNIDGIPILSLMYTPLSLFFHLPLQWFCHTAYSSSVLFEMTQFLILVGAFWIYLRKANLRNGLPSRYTWQGILLLIVASSLLSPLKASMFGNSVDTVAISLSILSALFFVHAKPSFRSSVLCGLLAGSTFFAKQTFIFIPFSFLFLYFLYFPSRRGWRGVAAFLLGCGLSVLLLGTVCSLLFGSQSFWSAVFIYPSMFGFVYEVTPFEYVPGPGEAFSFLRLLKSGIKSLSEVAVLSIPFAILWMLSFLAGNSPHQTTGNDETCCESVLETWIRLPLEQVTLLVVAFLSLPISVVARCKVGGYLNLWGFFFAFVLLSILIFSTKTSLPEEPTERGRTASTVVGFLIPVSVCFVVPLSMHSIGLIAIPVFFTFLFYFFLCTTKGVGSRGYVSFLLIVLFLCSIVSYSFILSRCSALRIEMGRRVFSEQTYRFCKDHSNEVMIPDFPNLQVQLQDRIGLSGMLLHDLGFLGDDASRVIIRELASSCFGYLVVEGSRLPYWKEELKDFYSFGTETSMGNMVLIELTTRTPE